MSLARDWWVARRARRAEELEQDTRVLWTYALADAVVTVADRAERLQTLHGTVRALEASAVGWSADLARAAASSCPGCRTRPVRPGYSGPYGPGASLASCCEPCSTTRKAVEAVFHRDPMRETPC